MDAGDGSDQRSHGHLVPDLSWSPRFGSVAGPGMPGSVPAADQNRSTVNCLPGESLMAVSAPAIAAQTARSLDRCATHGHNVVVGQEGRRRCRQTFQFDDTIELQGHSARLTGPSRETGVHRHGARAAVRHRRRRVWLPTIPGCGGCLAMFGFMATLGWIGWSCTRIFRRRIPSACSLRIFGIELSRKQARSLCRSENERP
jgi:hypothetical protein